MNIIKNKSRRVKEIKKKKNDKAAKELRIRLIESVKKKKNKQLRRVNYVYVTRKTLYLGFRPGQNANCDQRHLDKTQPHASLYV